MQDNQKHIRKLLQACKEQDQPAQFEIYKLYYKAMYNTALRIMKDSFEAEDVMQDSFLSAFTKLDSFTGNVAFGAWLKRIVINKSLTQLKMINKREEVKFEIVAGKMEDETIELEERVDYSRIKANEILKIIEQLKSNYRIILTLSLIEGYDNEEISHIMKISNENCRTTLSRAKNKLRNEMGQHALVN